MTPLSTGDRPFAEHGSAKSATLRRMRWINEPARRLLDQQLGLITRPQLLAAGYSAGEVDGRVLREDLETVECGTYRLPSAPVPPGQPAAAAVLRCRPLAALTGELVLALLKLEGARLDASPTVLVALNRRVQNVSFEVWPDGTWLGDRALVAGIRAVSVTRAIIDAACVFDDMAAIRFVDSARWLGLVKVGRLIARARQLPRHSGAQRILRLAARSAFDQESQGERQLAEAMDGIEPRLEWGVYIAPDIRVDALWRDVRLVLEYFGRDHHSRQRDRWHDDNRENQVRRLGYRYLEIYAEDLRDPAALRARLLGMRAGLLAASA